MADFQGGRREDTPIGQLPEGPGPEPGDFWKVLTPDGSRPIDVTRPEDHYWGKSDRYSQNLTGTVWGIWTPLGQYGMLSIHTVREHENGNISVLPGDGSSNSILVKDATGVDGKVVEREYHGYIYDGVWRDC